MSNSSLVSYTLISPSKNSPRNHVIDTITIHHMAGDLTVETCGKLFQAKKSSSNYGIGSDGRIALYVDESDRAWTSGSRVNDNRAVTIEVANDKDGVADKTWTVSDKAMASLIKLVADICKRNGIDKLVWSTNKTDRVNHKNGCNMTVHKDFQITACPGPYLYGKMSYIAAEVNKILSGETPKEEKPEVALPIVRKGTKGDNALQLQIDLNYFGYGLDEDGIIGNNSITALKAWQQTNGLTADGVYGAKSYQKMQELLK